MYSIVPKERLRRTEEIKYVDYTLSSTKDFHNLLPNLTYTFHGPYRVLVTLDTYEELEQIIKENDTYNHIMLFISAPSSQITMLSKKYPKLAKQEESSDFEHFKELLTFYNLQLADGCLKPLYYAIGADATLLTITLSNLAEKYPNTLITKDIINYEFDATNVTYPRQALLAFLYMDRWRWSKLKKCVNDFGNDMVFYSMRKGIQTLYKNLTTYYKTGEATKYTKTLPLQNLLLMRRCLEMQNSNCKDVYLLMYLYEKGETLNDYLYPKQSEN